MQLKVRLKVISAQFCLPVTLTAHTRLVPRTWSRPQVKNINKEHGWYSLGEKHNQEARIRFRVSICSGLHFSGFKDSHFYAWKILWNAAGQLLCCIILSGKTGLVVTSGVCYASSVRYISREKYSI